MDLSTPKEKLLMTLRQQLKVRHLNYRDVATQLNVSEATVKRYFKGKGVTVDVLQQIAEVVELDFFSVAMMAEDHHVVQLGLNSEQLAALKRRGPMRALYFLIAAGWTPVQIAKEFDVGQHIDSALAKLETLGLIRRLAKRRVKVLVRPSFGDRAYGEMSDLAIEAAREFMQSVNLRDTDCDLQFEVVRLSRDSALKFRKIVQHFQHEIRELTRHDLALPAEETEWFRLFLVAKRTARKDLLNWR